MSTSNPQTTDQQALDQAAVVPPTEGGGQIDHRHLSGHAKARGDRRGRAGLEGLGLAADELHRLAVEEVDGRDQHGRTQTPAAARACLTEATV